MAKMLTCCVMRVLLCEAVLHVNCYEKQVDYRQRKVKKA